MLQIPWVGESAAPSQGQLPLWTNPPWHPNHCCSQALPVGHLHLHVGSSAWQHTLVMSHESLLMAQIRRSPVEYGESTLLYKVSCIHFRWVLFAGVLNHQQGSTWRVNLLPQLKLMRRFGAVNGGLICIHIRSTLSLRRTSCHWRQGYELTWSGGCVRKPSEAVSWHCWRRKPFLAWSCSLEKGWVLQECPSSTSKSSSRIWERPFKMVFKSWFIIVGIWGTPPKATPPINKASLTGY